MSQEILRTEHISKSFGRVRALRDASIRLMKGEVLGLLGDNGAGKSTLMKIITGFHKPSGGALYFEGQKIELKSVSHARSLGIEPVYQDLALINELNVYRNMFLQREMMYGGVLRILDDRAMRERAKAQLKEIGVNIPSVDVEISKLSGGQRQAIAVARSVYANAKVLLLDEPTAAMGVKESAMILDLIRRLKERGEVSIIIVAHNYAHIFDVCDRVSLLQNGEITFDQPTKETSVEELTNLVLHELRSAREGIHRLTNPPKSVPSG
jgi:simple sugar transport system ATP-binding protein